MTSTSTNVAGGRGGRGAGNKGGGGGRGPRGWGEGRAVHTLYQEYVKKVMYS